MLLIIDNYDSFTYNLVQHFGRLGESPLIKRNDEITLAEIEQLQPTRICISPGPGRPEDAGISSELIRRFGPRVPVLGVCLGHQCIGALYGGQVVRAPVALHGKTSEIEHNNEGIFRGLAQPFAATRYHSLVVRQETFPAVLEITARSEDGQIMGLRHREFPIHGVQFHPESILTSEGAKLLANFLAL